MITKPSAGTILIVEDLPENLFLLSQLLQNQGYKIHAVKTGNEAIEAVNVERPDLMLLDIQLPDINGFEVCSILKSNSKTSDIPIIFISALNKTEDIIHGFSVGGIDYITKPFIAKEVLVRVHSFMEINRMRLQLEEQSTELRKRSEEALKQSETKYKTFLEESTDAIAIYTEGKIVFVNRAAFLLMKANSVEELIGKPVIEFIHPEYHKFIAERMIASSKSVLVLPSAEEKFIRLDGSIVDVEVKAVPTIFNNKPSIQLIIRDITERKLAENAMKESEARFKSLFDELGDAVFVTNIDVTNTGKILEVNPAAIRQTGYSRNELLKMNIVHDLLIPGSGDISTKDWNKKLLSGKTVTTTEKKKRKDGTEYWTEVIVTPIEFNGELASLSINHDITSRKLAEDALKESEEHFRAMFENASIGFYRTTAGGEILYANPALISMLGYTDFEELAQMDLEKNNLYTDTPRNEIIDLIDRQGYLKGHESVWKIKENKTISIRENTKAFYNPLGKVVHYEGTIEDISENKKAELLLKESEEKYRTLIENIQDGVFLIRDGRIVFANEAFSNMMGFSTNEIVGKNLNKYVAPEDLDKLTDYYNNKMNGFPGPKEYEFQVLHKDGTSRIFVNLTVERILFENKLSALGTIKDISETKKMNELISLREKYYRTLFDLSPSGIVVLDTKGTILDINESFCKDNGYTTAELQNKNISVLATEQERGNLEKNFHEILQGKTLQHEVENIAKDGTIRNLELHDTRVTLRDGQLGILSISNDITERIRAAKIQSVIYKISNAVNLTENLDELIAFIRKELGSLIDTTNFFVATYDENNDTIQLPYIADEVDTYTSFPAGKSLTAHLIKTKKSLLVTEDVLNELESSGQVEPVGSNSKIWMGIPMFVKGKVTGALVVQSYTDPFAYTEKDQEILEFVSHTISIAISRKKAEQDLVYALDKATESDRLKSAFLANMSHEIRTPMNGILGFAELLKEPQLSGEEQQEFVGIIEKSGTRMLNIINDLIDISKVESGLMEVYLSETNINEQIEYIYTFFKPEVERKGMQLFYKNALPKKEAFLKTDREKIYAILTNLVKNAIKYSDTGSIRFGYKKKNKHLEFFVKDTGIGIPKDNQLTIFDRFIQANNTLSSKYEGAGLGLAITKAYVEMLGGKIWVESEQENLAEGKAGGSTFYFTTPFDTNVELDEIPLDEFSNSIEEDQLKGIKILVAEDDKSSEMLISIILQKISSQIFFAKSGLEAVEICRKNPDLDLILMDIKMPEMDGYEAARQIRLFNEEVFIIAQTAFSLPGDKERALEAGCNDYISKPINRALLMETIHKHFAIDTESSK